jgi:hypothetical protein
MPDQPSPRRRFQFRRAILLALLAIGCVLAAWLTVQLYIARLDNEMEKNKPSMFRNDGKGTLIH